MYMQYFREYMYIELLGTILYMYMYDLHNMSRMYDLHVHEFKMNNSGLLRIFIEYLENIYISLYRCCELADINVYSTYLQR